MNKDKLGAFGFWATLGIVVTMVVLVLINPAKGKTLEGNVADKIGVTPQLSKILPLGLQFTDHTGKKVMLNELFGKGKPTVLVPLFYTCEGTCIMIGEATIDAVRGLKKKNAGEDFNVIMYSINPNETWKDAATKRARYVDMYMKKTTYYGGEKDVHSDPKDGWQTLTGSYESVKGLSDAIGYRYTYKPETGQINHPAAIVVVSPEGLISQYFYGMEYPSKLLLTSLDKAREEKLANIESQEMLLGCFQYNTVTGQYVFAASKVLLGASWGMVAIVFTSLMYLSFKYRTPKVSAESVEGLPEKN